jgi:hypothetical protein
MDRERQFRNGDWKGMVPHFGMERANGVVQESCDLIRMGSRSSRRERKITKDN